MLRRIYRSRALIRIAFATGVLFTVLRVLGYHLSDLPYQSNNDDDSTIFERSSDGRLPCYNLPGAEDTLVVMKTGSTELEAKLPIHFETSFQCYPNYIIFSDYAENFQGHVIIDALTDVSPEIQQDNPDFALWRRLKKHGRAALDRDELSGPEAVLASPTGRRANAGWKLDKWKFLPMANQTLHLYPDMKWYLFVETDTHVFWSTALAYLHSLDHKERWYIGAQMQIGSVYFAHGGSAFAMSRAGLEALVETFVRFPGAWEDYTQKHWAGDCVLGRAVSESTNLTWAWPIFDGDKPGVTDYTRFDYDKREYCYPTISGHHVSPAEIEDLWYFEQHWISKSKADFVRHRDVFHHYVIPHILSTGGEEDDWDNLSKDLNDAVDATSFEECRSICKANSTCVQYAFESSKCTTLGHPKLGESRTGVKSGWLRRRVKRFAADMVPCRKEKWIP